MSFNESNARVRIVNILWEFVEYSSPPLIWKSSVVPAKYSEWWKSFLLPGRWRMLRGKTNKCHFNSSHQWGSQTPDSFFWQLQRWNLLATTCTHRERLIDFIARRKAVLAKSCYWVSTSLVLMLLPSKKKLFASPSFCLCCWVERNGKAIKSILDFHFLPVTFPEIMTCSFRVWCKRRSITARSIFWKLPFVKRVPVKSWE